MRNVQYPNVEDTAEGERIADEFRSTFVMTHPRDSFETLRAVDGLLKPLGFEIVNLGEGSDPLFRIEAIVPDGSRQTTECCYLDADNDIFMREQHGRSYRYYPRNSFPSSDVATQHIGRKPGMDLGRVSAMCRIAFGRTTPEQEGLTSDDVYRTLEELGQN